MDTNYEFLAEKESMWAEMLIQILKDNDIPYTALPVHGAGLTIKAGIQERLRIFVPGEKKSRAEELLKGLLPDSENQ